MSFEFSHRIDNLLRKAYLGGYDRFILYDMLKPLFDECENDLTRIKHKLRELGYFVPYMGYDKLYGTPLIKKFSYVFYLDGERCHTKHPSREVAARYHRNGFHGAGYANYLSEAPHELTQVYDTADTGSSYTLHDWISHGYECSCGNHYINPYGETECAVCTAVNEPMQYSTRAEDLLGHEDTEELKVGIELEYEGVFAKDVARTIKGHAIAKRDATIHNGIEVVTRPACIKTHKDTLKKFFDGVTTKASPNTGMHIHVEKKRITQYQIGFMLWFVNSEDNYPFLQKVAGRDYKENAYTCLQSGTKMTSHMFYDDQRKMLVRGESGKYVPLNTNKNYTYEFRIFRSPESHLEMSAKLDFVKALIDYASPYSFTVKTLKDKGKVENFIRYVADNKKQYPDFVAYFKEMF